MSAHIFKKDFFKVRRPSGGVGDSSFLPQHEFPLPPFNNNNRRRNSSTSSNVLPPQTTKILQQHPPLPQKTKNEKNTKGGIGENENIGNSSTTGGGSSGGGGFLSGKIGGLFSKITQLQGHNTMKLPDDKNPEVFFQIIY